MQTGCVGQSSRRTGRFGALHGVIHAAGNALADNGLQEINDCHYGNCEEALSGQGARLDGVGRSA